MGSRLRILAFGCAAALVIAGGVCAVVLGGITGEVLTIVLISAGLGGGLLLIFLEVGFGEQRELAREAASREEQERRARDARRRPRLGRWPRRLR